MKWLICLLRGHDWRETIVFHKDDDPTLSRRCRRCKRIEDGLPF